jgi:hypothetical protein
MVVGRGYRVELPADVGGIQNGEAEISFLTTDGTAIVLILKTKLLYSLRDNIDRALADRKPPIRDR